MTSQKLSAAEIFRLNAICFFPCLETGNNMLRPLTCSQPTDMQVGAASWNNNISTLTSIDLDLPELSGEHHRRHVASMCCIHAYAYWQGVLDPPLSP